MDREDAKRLREALMGRSQAPAALSEEDGKWLPIREMIEELVGLSEEAFGLYAWSRDPLNKKVGKDKQLEYMRRAENCGREEAALLSDEFQRKDPIVLAEKLGIVVKNPDIPNGGGHVIFAQFVEPGEVTVFMDSVDKAKVLILEEGLEEIIGTVDVYGLLLAHEIFHFVEFQKEKAILTQTERIELWRKPFSNRSRMVCLSEMAGMAFARELMGLTYSPYLFDVLLMYCYNKVAATELYEEMMEYIKEDDLCLREN